MPFPTVAFCLLFAATILALAFYPKNWDKSYIFITSGLACFWQSPATLALITYLIAVVHMHNSRSAKAPPHKFHTALFTFFVVAPLLWCKYSLPLANFFFTQTEDIFKFLYSSPLPPGISFLTFGALIWMYTPQSNLTRPEQLAGFTFLGTNVSGPLMAPSAVGSQIAAAHVRIPISALYQISCGLFLKLVVASSAQNISDPIFNDLLNQGILGFWIGGFFYSIQIYADFAGYSLMAIGIASLMGIRIIRNFHAPYWSGSLTDFWRRWHISLSMFWKKFVYIPLGGSRVSKPRQYFNLIFVMALCGIWHGAGLGFLIWGILNGLYLVFERIVLHGKRALPHASPLRPLFWGILTFFIVCLLWIPFRLDSHDALRVALQSVKDNPWSAYTATPAELIKAIGLLAVILFEQRWGSRMCRFLQLLGHRFYALSFGLCFLICALALYFAPEGLPNFIYFSF